ncbi:MAG: hypothetical protein ACLUEU_08960 [Oscillospiraceae bacterium]
MDGELKSLSELTEVIIPQSQIIYARTNSSGQIDLIALSGTDVNSYGRRDGRVREHRSRIIRSRRPEAVCHDRLDGDLYGRTQMPDMPINVGDFVALAGKRRTLHADGHAG